MSGGPQIPPGGIAGQTLFKTSASNWAAGSAWVGMTLFAASTGTQTTNNTTTGQHMGFNKTLTMQRTGIVLLVGRANAGTNNAGNAVYMELHYGTGTPPVLGAAATGTIIGLAAIFQCPTAGATGDLNAIGLVGPLTLGTTYWFDCVKSVGLAGTGTFGAPMLFGVEL